uniref:Uncharacterized protein n=1 Tax=Ananas comosus var. bracteatus TaxID=296719 RepID=A0A6V7QHX2_ANACO|nr:unnamed protein product [Ananas comosus var. bracteatus]
MEGKNIGDLAPLYPEVAQKSPSRIDLLSLLIKEKRTLIHCHGLGLIPDEFRKSKTTRADYIRMLSETKKEAEEEKRVMQEELADMKQKYEDMHNEMMTMKALVESIGKKPQILGKGISCIPQGHKLSGTALPHDGSPPNNGASSSHSSYEAPPTQVHQVKTILPRKVQVVSNIVAKTKPKNAFFLNISCVASTNRRTERTNTFVNLTIRSTRCTTMHVNPARFPQPSRKKLSPPKAPELVVPQRPPPEVPPQGPSGKCRVQGTTPWAQPPLPAWVVQGPEPPWLPLAAAKDPPDASFAPPAGASHPPVAEPPPPPPAARPSQ